MEALRHVPRTLLSFVETDLSAVAHAAETHVGSIVDVRGYSSHGTIGVNEMHNAGMLAAEVKPLPARLAVLCQSIVHGQRTGSDPGKRDVQASIEFSSQCLAKQERAAGPIGDVGNARLRASPERTFVVER